MSVYRIAPKKLSNSKDSIKLCLLDNQKLCNDCGDCDRCDLEPDKICDNCGRCLNEADYNGILITKIIP